MPDGIGQSAQLTASAVLDRICRLCDRQVALMVLDTVCRKGRRSGRRSDDGDGVGARKHHVVLSVAAVSAAEWAL